MTRPVNVTERGFEHLLRLTDEREIFEHAEGIIPRVAAQMSSIPIPLPSSTDCRVDETDSSTYPMSLLLAMVRRTDGSLLIYDGNNITFNVAVSHQDVLPDLCRRSGPDPHSGSLLY